MKKLILSLVFITLASILGIGWSLDYVFDRYSGEADSSLLASYTAIGKQLALSLDELANTEEFVLAWNSTNKNKIALTMKQDFPLPVELEYEFKNGEGLVLESDGMLSLHYFMPLTDRVLSFSPDDFILKPDQVTLSFVLTLMFYSGILLLMLLWLYPLLSGLKSLRTSVLNVGEGKLSERINVSRVSYIADIEHEFNRMAGKIESLVRDNKLISSAVSHDLRTPLSRLRFGMDVLSETTEPLKRVEYQKHMSDDIDEMHSLVEVLLNYAKLEHALVKITKQPVDLSTLIHELVQTHNHGAIRVESSGLLANICVQGNKQYLKMLMQNILNNAVNYAKKVVFIEFAIKDDHVLISIHDDGPGISVQQRDSIFQPFVKGDNGGFGMGLAIAERIAHWHKVKIDVHDSTMLQGTMFKLDFIKLP